MLTGSVVFALIATVAGIALWLHKGEFTQMLGVLASILAGTIALANFGQRVGSHEATLIDFVVLILAAGSTYIMVSQLDRAARSARHKIHHSRTGD